MISGCRNARNVARAAVRKCIATAENVRRTSLAILCPHRKIAAMGLRKSDHPERRKIALMRRADTESGATHNIGGVKKRIQRPKPSLPKTPWDDDVLGDVGRQASD